MTKVRFFEQWQGGEMKGPYEVEPGTTRAQALEQHLGSNGLEISDPKGVITETTETVTIVLKKKTGGN